MAFPDRAAAMRWIVRNQIARRNLDVGQRADFAARLVTATKGGNQSANLPNGSVTTTAQAAADAGVSTRSVVSAKKVLDKLLT